MTRRNLRTLTLKAAAARTGLPAERLRRAVHAGEIATFREPVKPGRLVRTTVFLLEDSLEAWFNARVSGGSNQHLPPVPPDPGVDAMVADAFDVDEDLLKDIPRRERLFS